MLWFDISWFCGFRFRFAVSSFCWLGLDLFCCFDFSLCFVFIVFAVPFVCSDFVSGFWFCCFVGSLVLLFCICCICVVYLHLASGLGCLEFLVCCLALLFAGVRWFV